MSSRSERWRDWALGWTTFVTVFTWTPTMRMFLKPEISQWSIFGISGSGRSPGFWILPTAAVLALFLFYLEGRGRMRGLFHGLLLAWHLPLTAAIVYVSLRQGPEAKFVGGAWGVQIPLPILALPFVFFSALAVRWVLAERRGEIPVPTARWTEISGRKLLAAALLLPLIVAFFDLGEGFDTRARIAIVACVVQWILLAEGLGRPKKLVGRSAVERGTGTRSDPQ